MSGAAERQRRRVRRSRYRAVGGAAPPGIALLETLVALVLVLVALLLVAGVLAVAAEVAAAARAQREALAALEGVLEEVRVGAWELAPMSLGEEDLPFALAYARGARVRIDVEPAGVEDLLRVRARIRYGAGRRTYARTLETLVWAPP